MNLDPKVQCIIDWRESLSTLSDERFFELIRMYLGEIKTPFNKQKLIEELSSFIRKEENNKFIIKLLDKDDLKIISAIFYMPSLTMQKLEKFFYKTYTYASLYEHIANLEERLIVFTKKDEKLNKKVLCINPLLQDSIKPFVSINLLFPICQVQQNTSNKDLVLSPTFIASFVSYLLVNPDICKADGSFKKKAETELQNIFGSTLPLSSLFVALKNLSIIYEAENKFLIDFELFNNFAELAPLLQYMYLCSASVGHFSRTVLQSNAQLLYDTLLQMNANCLQRDFILKLSFMIKERSSLVQDASQGRFARMMESRMLAENKKLAESNLTPSEESLDSGIMDFMLDTCLAFGILTSCSKESSMQEVLKLSDTFLDLLKGVNNQTSIENKSLLSVDASFSVTIMPGLLLKDLLDLVLFLTIIRYDTVALFEINKQSIMRAFDKGIKPEQIIELLKKYSLYELSQNLIVCIQEWYTSYTSATLYKGYVLKVMQDKIVFVERNPILSKHIKTVLAPGVYLLDFANEEDANSAIKKCGLDFIGGIKSEEQIKKVSMSLPYIKTQNRYIFNIVKDVELPSDNKSEYLQELKNALFKLQLPEDQQEGLLDRINRRIIINEKQLCGESVRFEKIEATGMDYTGKIHVIDSAMQKKTLLEIEMEGEEQIFVGTPIALNKKENDAELILVLAPEEIQKVFSVAKASRIKKLRGSSL